MDCRQTQRKRYNPEKVNEGRSKVRKLLEQCEGVASVTLHESELSRNEDGELLDKYYVALSDSSIHSRVVQRVEQAQLPVYESNMEGSTLELTLCHASYLYAQDTLYQRFSTRSLLELFICCSFIGLLFVWLIL